MKFPKHCVLSILALVGVICLPEIASSGSVDSSGSLDADFKQALEAVTEADSPDTALARTLFLDEYNPYIEPKHFASRLERLANRGDITPFADFQLHRLAAKSRLNTRDLKYGSDGMDGPLGRQGCLTNWAFVGPFDNASGEGFSKRLPPEQGVEGPYQGKDGVSINWRTVENMAKLCRIPVGDFVSSSRNAVAFLSTRIDVEGAKSAFISVSATGPYKIWIDGKSVGKIDRKRGMGVGAQLWPVDLDSGKHTVFIELASAVGGQMQSRVRLLDSDLKPLTDLDAESVESSADVDAADSAKKMAAESLSQRLRDDRTSSAGDSIWRAWLWKQTEPLDSSQPWKDLAAEVYTDLSNGNIDTSDWESLHYLLLADVLAKQRMRLQVLKRGVQQFPDESLLVQKLIEAYRTSSFEEHKLREKDRLTDLENRHPNSLITILGWTNWYADRGYIERAHRRLTETIGRSPTRPMTARTLLSLREQMGGGGPVRQSLRLLMDLRALNPTYALRYATHLAKKGEPANALDVLDKQRKITPHSMAVGKKKIRILRSMGRHRRALDEVENLLEWYPRDLDLLHDKADLYVEMDRKDSAIQVLDKALDAHPNSNKTRTRLYALQGTNHRFYEPWMVDAVGKLVDQNDTQDNYAHDIPLKQTVVRVSPSGLATRVVQKVGRAVTADGVDDVRYEQIPFRKGDERVEVLNVEVIKQDGSLSTEFDQWVSGGARKGDATYTDTSYFNIRAANVEQGDLVVFRYKVTQVANDNFRGNYFGDIDYVQDSVPIGMYRYVVLHPRSWNLYFRDPSLSHHKITTLPDGSSPREGYQLNGIRAESVPAVETDPDQPGHSDVYDYTMVSNKKTYDEIAAWWWNLIEEQLVASDTIREKTTSLTEGLESEKAKAKAIHNYVVRQTRYLHVGLGIHGWKPYRTSAVFQNKYGDCKDKAALLKVMLEQIGIETRMVLVRTRQLGHVDASPANMHIFDHAIVYIPRFDWYLDGTAEFSGTGQLPPMDQGANALIVNGDNGTGSFVNLPIDKPEDNLLRQSFEIKLDSKMNSSVTGRLVAHGQHAVKYRKNFEDKNSRIENLQSQISNLYPGAVIDSATFEHLSDLEKPTQIEFSFNEGKIARTSGQKAFLYPLGFPIDLRSRYASQASRTRDLVLDIPFVNHTTVTYQLPEGRAFGDIPADVDIDFDFSALSIDYRVSDRKLTVDAQIELKQHRIEASRYQQFRSAMAKMTRLLGKRISVIAAE